MRRFQELSIYSKYQLCTLLDHSTQIKLKLHNSDVFSRGMLEYGDGPQTVRQTTRGKLITFDP